MKHRQLLFALFIGSAAFVIAGAVARISQGQSQHSNSQTTHSSQAASTTDDQVPLVDYDAPLPANPEDARKREQRSRKYDGGSGILVYEGKKEVLEIPDASSTGEALPMKSSDLIVLGTIRDAKAFLSNDKTAVYSEFEVTVDGVIRQDSLNPATVGCNITIERMGGRVRLLSKSVLRRGEIGHNLPIVGAQYVLFLRRNADAEDYSILTGYKVNGSTVYPLDGVPYPASRAFKEFDAYKNVPLSDFLLNLENLVRESAKGGN